MSAYTVPKCGATCHRSIVSSTLKIEIISLIIEIKSQGLEGTHKFFEVVQLQLTHGRIGIQIQVCQIPNPILSDITLYHLCSSSRGSHSGHLEEMWIPGPISRISDTVGWVFKAQESVPSRLCSVPSFKTTTLGNLFSKIKITIKVLYCFY